jgi:signal transduction histidine kinase/ligand-binding sensor domain-containing protein
MGRNRSGSPGVDRLLAVPLLICCLALSSTLRAQDQTIAQMLHTSWTGRDGAPQSIGALAQTPDGMLWIGSSAGLFSFDGFKFALFKSRSGSPLAVSSSIQSLMVSKRGDLWVFFFHGPAACIHEGSARLYDHAENEAITVLDHAQQDSDGNIFAVLNWRYLVSLGPDDVWHKAANPIAGAGDISGVFVDSANTQWVVENNLLYRKAKGASSFKATEIHIYGSAKFAENRDRTFWVIGQRSGPGAENLQRVDSDGHKLFAPRVVGDLSDIVTASDGSVWIQTEVGLRRLRSDEIALSSNRSFSSPDLFQLQTGISGVQAQALLVDTDGNVWVGGMSGLNRFEHANLMPAVVPSKINAWFTCVDADGDVWVATGDGQLFTINDGHRTQLLNRDGGTNLFCGTHEGAYFIQDSGISVVRRGHVRHLPLLPGLTEYGLHYLFLGLVEDSEGELIAAVGGRTGQGLWKYAKGKWSRFLENLTLPEVCAMLDDGENGLYLAFTPPDGRIGIVRRGSLRMQSVSIGTSGFARTSYGILAYGRRGIAIQDDKNFQPLSFLHPEHARIVTGAVEAPGGDLWLMGASGVVRIPAAEVRAAMADTGYLLSSVNFQEGDFVGPDITLLFRRSADIDKNGRLWFSMLNGVVSVDPHHLTAPRHPPLLSIHSIVADGREMGASATFPPDTHTLEIKYFGLDLTDPRRVVYRYRLEGLESDLQDSTWQDVGPRTEATYSHLRPGRYRFQVIASNGGDAWTQPVSSAMFRILPHFYERPWVQAIFALAVILLIWMGISFRINHVSNSIRIRAEERADERIRIARDLHDTLLQGVQGLLLNFHVAAENVPADHVSKKALERALATADRIILEGRDRVSRLRAENLKDAELKLLIESVAANFETGNAIDFAVQRMGGSDILQSHVADEIFCIAREALTNAFRHSGASRVVVELDYQSREFRMSCRDNGRGFDPKAFRERQGNGHWGLRGMEERAEGLGARLSLTSAAENGTEVHITMPARLAYLRHRRFENLLRRKPAA